MDGVFQPDAGHLGLLGHSSEQCFGTEPRCLGLELPLWFAFKPTPKRCHDSKKHSPKRIANFVLN